MGKAKNFALIILILSLSLFLSLSVSAQEKINTFIGNATIGGAPANGSVVDAFIGSASSPAASYTVGSEPDSVGSGRYILDFECASGSVAFLKVWGINATWRTCSNILINNTNLSVSLVANDGTCSYSNACSSTVCCSGTTQVNSSTSSGTCKSTCAATTTTDTGGGGSSGGGGGGGAAAPAPAPAPSQDTKDVVKEALPESFKEADAAGNVKITTVAAPEIKTVPISSAAAASAIEYAVDYLAKTEEAKQALNAIQEAVSSGGATAVSVKKTIEVVKATNTVTKEEIIVSVVKLAITAPGNQDLKNVEVVEVIPKAAASNVNQVTFKGEKPQVLEADPVVKWFFSQVSKGTTKDLSYTVNKDIRNVGTTTVGVQGRAEAVPSVQPPAAPAVPEKGKVETALPKEVKKPTPVSTAALTVIVALLVVAGWLFIKTRKKPMK
ncbi:hypothetical protein HYV83_00235 [Candidatus Woesearchaeota archaeon]|nr:hypothetical protein [Candidatus Woesearchaeota archaeon]